MGKSQVASPHAMRRFCHHHNGFLLQVCVVCVCEWSPSHREEIGGEMEEKREKKELLSTDGDWKKVLLLGMRGEASHKKCGRGERERGETCLSRPHVKLPQHITVPRVCLFRGEKEAAAVFFFLSCLFRRRWGQGPLFHGIPSHWTGKEGHKCMQK